MQTLPNWQVLIALLRDGFNAGAPGGVVRLRDDGSPELDYPFTPYLWNGVRRAMASMAELQFAAGASKVMPVHARGAAYGDLPGAQRAIESFALAPRITPVVSAHVMGGAPFGSDETTSVVGLDGRHHHLANLHVLDGSLFPTSIGANPQLSIYAIVARLADGLAQKLSP
jgi:choline dehydrogenase-like flavoprotein